MSRVIISNISRRLEEIFALNESLLLIVLPRHRGAKLNERSLRALYLSTLVFINVSKLLSDRWASAKLSASRSG